MLKASRTIADLAGSEEIMFEHVAEALSYREGEALSWMKNIKTLLLNSLEGQGRKLWHALKRGQLSIDELRKCDAKLFTELGITERAAVAIKTKIDMRWAETEFETCIKLGIRTVGIDDGDYPGKAERP